MFSKKGIKINNEQFDLRLNEFNFKRIDPYINTNTSITFECLFCGNLKKMKPKEIKQKLKCNCIEDNENYTNSIKHKNIIPLQKYVNIRTHIKHKCLVCNTEFISSPKSVKSSKWGCPSCSGKKFNKEAYIKKLPNDIILIDDKYNGTDKKHLHKCLTCNNVWNTKPNYILHMNTGCPNCASSKGEKEISLFLESIDLEYTKEYNISIKDRTYKFDFFIPSLDMFIEYDGIHHFESLDYFGGEESYKKIVLYDKIKNNWCKENNFILLRISYKENIKDVLSTIFLK
jgi:ribosomal protein L37AE/L43A